MLSRNPLSWHLHLHNIPFAVSLIIFHSNIVNEYMSLQMIFCIFTYRKQKREFLYLYLKENGKPARGKHWSIFIKQFDLEELKKKGNYIHTVRKCVSLLNTLFATLLIFSHFLIFHIDNLVSAVTTSESYSIYCRSLAFLQHKNIISPLFMFMFFRGFNVFEKYLQKEEKKFKNIYSSQKQRKITNR